MANKRIRDVRGIMHNKRLCILYMASLATGHGGGEIGKAIQPWERVCQQHEQRNNL